MPRAAAENFDWLPAVALDCTRGGTAGRVGPNGWGQKLRPQRPVLLHPPVRPNAKRLPSTTPRRATAVASGALSA